MIPNKYEITLHFIPAEIIPILVTIGGGVIICMVVWRWLGILAEERRNPPPQPLTIRDDQCFGSRYRKFNEV